MIQVHAKNHTSCKCSFKQYLVNDFKAEIFRFTERDFCFNDPNRYCINLITNIKQIRQWQHVVTCIKYPDKHVKFFI